LVRFYSFEAFRKDDAKVVPECAIAKEDLKKANHLFRFCGYAGTLSVDYESHCIDTMLIVAEEFDHLLIMLWAHATVIIKSWCIDNAATPTVNCRFRCAGDERH
jgi:hypothetical protein